MELWWFESEKASGQDTFAVSPDIQPVGIYISEGDPATQHSDDPVRYGRTVPSEIQSA